MRRCRYSVRSARTSSILQATAVLARGIRPAGDVLVTPPSSAKGCDTPSPSGSMRPVIRGYRRERLLPLSVLASDRGACERRFDMQKSSHDVRARWQTLGPLRWRRAASSSGGSMSALPTAVPEALAAGSRAALAVLRARVAERCSPRRALLLDLDALGVPREAVVPAINAVLRAAGPCRYRTAAGHPFHALDAERACLVLGVAVLRTRSRPDSADHALLSAAYEMRAVGVTHFVVCSNDGRFVHLPGTFEVLTTGRSQVSQKLLRGATQVRVVEPDRKPSVILTDRMAPPCASTPTSGAGSVERAHGPPPGLPAPSERRRA